MKARPLAIDGVAIDRFRGISFDLFGTIVRLDEDRMPGIMVAGIEHRTLLAAPLKLLAEHGSDVSPYDAVAAYAAAVAQTGRRLAAADGRELSPEWTFARFLERLGLPDRELARTLAASFMDATVQSAAPAAGLTSLLETLRGRGMSLGLISNLADGDGGRRLLRRLGLDRLFDAMVFSGDVGWRKPDARIYRRAAAQLGRPVEALLHIGDEWEADVIGARVAGFSAVWIAQGNGHATTREGVRKCTFPQFARLATSGWRDW